MRVEDVIDELIAALHLAGALPGTTSRPTPWDIYRRISRCVHAEYEVTATSITSRMSRLLFALGGCLAGGQMAVAGSFQGYSATWLAAGAAAAGHDVMMTAVDPDAAANATARRNLACIDDVGQVTVVDGRAEQVLAVDDGPLDAVLLDLDDPVFGKAGYSDVLRVVSPRLSRAALVLAHDARVPRFAADFTKWKRVVEEDTALAGPWMLPVDECGLALVHRR